MPRETYPPHQVVLVRQGETALNAAGRLRGRFDPPLAGAGFQQVRDLARFLAIRRPSRIVSGPLLRTVQTAELIARAVGLQPVIDDDLIDRDYGQWAGELETDVLEQWGSLDAAPGVEPADSVRARATRALQRQLLFLGTRPVVMVSHDAVKTQLLSILDTELGRPDRISQRTACFNELLYAEGGWTVQSIDQLPQQSPRCPIQGRQTRNN